MDSSELVSKITDPVKNIFYYHKKKVLFFIFTVALFLVVLFPYSDLTSFSKDEINKNLKSTGLSADFSKISLNLYPFGVQTTDLEVGSRTFKKPLSAGSVTLRPNLISLMQFKLGGTALFSDLFSGDAKLSLTLDGKTDEDTQKFKINLETEGLSLEEIASFQNLPLKLKGLIGGNLEMSGEESFRTQPQGTFRFNLKNAVIPDSIPIPNFGDFPLPKKIIWENSNLFGKIEKGKIQITNGTLGTKKAPLNGRYRGFINCSFSKSKMACTNYDFKVELELNAEFERKLASQFKTFFTKDMVNIQKLPQGGAKYSFTVQGDASNRRRPPRVRRLSSFD